MKKIIAATLWLLLGHGVAAQSPTDHLTMDKNQLCVLVQYSHSQGGIPPFQRQRPRSWPAYFQKKPPLWRPVPRRPPFHGFMAAFISGTTA